MNDQDRVMTGLDVVAGLSVDTYERAKRVSIISSMFPEVDIVEALEAAADLQVQGDSEANSMDLLTDHVAAEVRKRERADRRYKKEETS